MDKQTSEMVIAQLATQGERLNEYNATLVRLTVTVEEHVKRTNLLEAEVKPIKQHVQFVNTLCKFGAAAAAFILVLKNLGLVVF